jgi:hypothetical protein
MTSSNGGPAGQAQFTEQGVEHDGVLRRCIVAQGASAVADVSGDAGVVVDVKLEAGLACVNVQLAGFSITTGDSGSRNVRELTVGIGEVHYDDKTGDLQFVVFARFYAVHETEEFVKFQVFYTILALG